MQLRKNGIINSRSKGEGGTRGTRKKKMSRQVQKRREKEGKVMLSLATLQYTHTAL